MCALPDVRAAKSTQNTTKSQKRGLRRHECPRNRVKRRTADCRSHNIRSSRLVQREQPLDSSMLQKHLNGILNYELLPHTSPDKPAKASKIAKANGHSQREFRENDLAIRLTLFVFCALLTLYCALSGLVFFSS